MSWLKRNWLLLVGVLLTLGALAGSVVFLITQIKTEATYDAQAKSYIDAYKAAIGAQVFPNDANIQLARDGAEQFKKFGADAHLLLTPPAVLKTNTLGFKSLLENTIAELQTSASGSGIAIPPRYAFSFEGIRPMTSIPSNVIDQLTIQVADVKELAGILIQSKVHSIDSIRRIRVIADEGAGRPDYLDGLAMLATAHVTITPYEISFRGLSAELSGVLDALQRSHTYYVVKKLTVDNLSSVEATGITVGGANTNSAPTTATNAVVGLPTTPKPAVKAPPKPTGPITVIDEKPFRATLFLEVVKAKNTGT